MGKQSGPNGTAPGYYWARPQEEAVRGVLVLHAWWGLNQFVRGFCDRLAGAGFVALAPDLYHGRVAVTIEEAKKLRSTLKQETVSGQIGQAAADLQAACGTGERKIGVVGFSLGGYWALWLADQTPCPVAATVAFYGARSGEYSHSTSAFQVHLAQKDPYTPASAAKKLEKALKAAGRPAEFYTYPDTTHWFFESDRSDAFHAQAAELAWARTKEFLGRYV